MSDFGLGLPKLVTLDLHDNSITGEMRYSTFINATFTGDDDYPMIPRMPFVATMADTEAATAALFDTIGTTDSNSHSGSDSNSNRKLATTAIDEDVAVKADDHLRMAVKAAQAGLFGKLQNIILRFNERGENSKATRQFGANSDAGAGAGAASDDDYTYPDNDDNGWWPFDAKSALSTIDVSHNKLTGSIMGDFATFRELMTLNVAHNRFTGNLDAFNRPNTWTRLTSTDFSDNRFKGEFSACALAVEMQDNTAAAATSKIIATDNKDLTDQSVLEQRNRRDGKRP